MSSVAGKSPLAHSCRRAALALILVAVAGLTALIASAPVRADEGCDSSEQVACIPLPSDATPAPGGPVASGGASGAAVAAVPAPGILCAIGSCCPPLPRGVEAPTAASPAVPGPIGGYCPPYPPNWCYPPLASGGMPGSAVSTGAAVAAVPAPGPIPQPVYCSPYRSIYTTINLGNAADVRALRTVTTDGLRPYWQGSAFSQIASQVSQLQAVGDYATARLYSIQVQSGTIDILSSTASVRTLEHWLYQELSQFDGSLVYSQDEWVTNRYTLSPSGNGWTITNDTITVTGGPVPIPLPASGG